eukprot:CAMPEP_0117674976 /NCGR_PEP_ID=MMETSP0804-20121206/15346_1 /TAXON_ID=1074897 /ORGANISM="Tetraselmis astigmatica, Strain CCMP880" /LENGTH=1011 /DNA_ID=CAMNT_0005483923 /DNA_START=47 /DNA_END=3082 /DNA_ORIENTATION=-
MASRMRRGCVSCVVALLFCLGLFAGGFPAAEAIHEDQLGRFDWHHRFLGQYSTALFSKSRARMAVATNRNALAVLSLRTGEVEWRQVFGETDQIQQIVMTEKPAALFTLSSDGKESMLRAWNQHTGALVWDMPLGGEGSLSSGAGGGGAALAHMGPEQTDAVQKALLFVISCGELKAINTSTAEVAWTYNLPEGITDARLLPNPLAASLTVVGVSRIRADAFVEVVTVSVVDGNRLKGARIPTTDAMGTIGASQVAVSRGAIMSLAAGDSSICEAAIVEGAEFHCRPVSEVLGGLPSGALATLTTAQPFSSLLLKVTGGKDPATLHYLLDPTKGGLPKAQVKKLGDFDASCVLHLEGGGDVIAAVTSSSEGVSWGVFDGATGEELHKEDVTDFQRWHRKTATASGATPIEQCFLASFTRKDGATGWRLLAVASDDSAVLLQQSKVVWVREESLAGVVSSLAVDFPKTSGGLEGTIGLSAMQNLQKQILTLKTQMGMASVAETAELNELRHAGSDVMLSTPDPSGFRKLLITLSDTGKLLALHNGDGHVVWGLSYDPVCPPEVLHVWQQPHSLTISPKVAVFRTNTELCDGFVSVVDAHTGSEVSSTPLEMPVSQILPLPFSFRVGPAEQRMFLAVSSDGAHGSPPIAHLLPAFPEAAAAFAPHAASATFWQIQQAPVPALKGYAIVAKPGDKSTAAFEAVEIWSVVVGAGSEILEVVQRDSGSVHSRVKVLGDRSMLVKYLNPNTIFMATSSAPSSFSNEGSELEIHIIDTVTGRHLFRQVHKGATGPVKATLCENWAVYHYFSTLNVRHEMGVVELYDDSTARSLSLAEAVFSNSSKAISSTNPIAIKTLRQTFFFNQGVKFISATHTTLGISAKRLLIGTTGDQVYALDKRFVDPRRPLGTPTNADKEERLMPYKPELGLNPPFFVTYDKAVAGVRGVDTFTTTLESTTLMLAYGLDLSYTRLAPSKSFDMLDDDFSYALLIATLLGMASLCIYLQITKQQNELAKKWA